MAYDTSTLLDHIYIMSSSAFAKAVVEVFASLMPADSPDLLADGENYANFQ
jgi:hypothetical protein